MSLSGGKIVRPAGGVNRVMLDELQLILSHYRLDLNNQNTTVAECTTFNYTSELVSEVSARLSTFIQLTLTLDKARTMELL